MNLEEYIKYFNKEILLGLKIIIVIKSLKIGNK